MNSAVPADAALSTIWRDAGQPAEALDSVLLPGSGAVVPSSFNVATAAQASIAAAALAAAEIWHLRSGSARQKVSVAREHAALDCVGYYTLDGKLRDPWDKISGLYPCGPDGQGGWVRIHANFAHHRDGALNLLACPPGPATEREAVGQALRHWQARDFEDAAANAGLVVSAMRSFEDWDAHPHAKVLAATPLVRIERIPEDHPAPPREWPALDGHAPPLQGIRVLDLTRILAGPVAGRTLAAYGADVMLVNAPHLPNIDAIADTSRGKWSCHVDLRAEAGRAAMRDMLSQAHVFLQGYRPGALQGLGFGAADLARMRPGIVVVSLSAYGDTGPWAGRRGFDSLVQTATGFNHAEAMAAGKVVPQALPMQILDFGAGYLLAFGAQVALMRQAREGGSWQVKVSLAGVGHWLRTLGRVPDGFAAIRPAFSPYLEETDSGFGRLVAVRHAAQFSRTPAGWARRSEPPGTHGPRWPSQ